MHVSDAVQSPLLSPNAPSDAAVFVGFLAADSTRQQPLCGDPEGWGPVSRYRWDLTSCFLDVWITTVAVLFGILGGGAAVYYLLRKCAPQPVRRNWHFYAKLVSCLLVARIRRRAWSNMSFCA